MDLELELVAAGLVFPEGPIAMADGSIILVEIQAHRLSRVSPKGERTTIADLGGGPNGAAIGPDGAVYVCNNGGMIVPGAETEYTPPPGVAAAYPTGSIQRVDLKTGAFSTLYTECDGVALLGPNDIVFDAHGGFWFTDLGKIRDNTIEQGALYHALPDGSKIVRARHSMITPNGVGLSPDGKTVWVAETLTSRVRGFAIEAPGQIAAQGNLWAADGKVLGALPGYQMLDSLAVEASGKVCVATLVSGAVTVFDPDGSTEQFATGDMLTTNICFGGADMRDAWITCSGTGTLKKTRWPRPGLKLNFNG
jgi:gluconolactonase